SGYVEGGVTPDAQRRSAMGTFSVALGETRPRSPYIGKRIFAGHPKHGVQERSCGTPLSGRSRRSRQQFVHGFAVSEIFTARRPGVGSKRQQSNDDPRSVRIVL